MKNTYIEKKDITKDNIELNIFENLKSRKKLNYIMIGISILIAFNGAVIADYTYNDKYLIFGTALALIFLLNFTYKSEQLRDPMTNNKLEIIHKLKEIFLNKDKKIIIMNKKIGLIANEEDRIMFLNVLDKGLSDIKSLTNEDFYYIVDLLFNKFECYLSNDRYILKN